MQFPRILEDWNYDIIKELVDKDYFETEFFDFKADLQPAPDQEKIVCAFANTIGGFLIFGVRDINKPDRIIGIGRKRDMSKQFQDKIRKINPSVYYVFKQPPIQIPNSDNVIHVCSIPRSSERPHMTSKNYFYIRTSGGCNELMNYNTIRESFYGFEQRKIKVEMLGLELTYLRSILKEMIVPESEMENKYSLYEAESSILIDLMGQTYSIIKDDQRLISRLLEIRGDLGYLNQCRRSFLFHVSLQRIDRSFLYKQYNQKVKGCVDKLTKNINEALVILKKKFGFVIPTEKASGK
jgi:predicted HTH transcriptional regulator